MNKEKINETLKTILDPELFIDVVTLGLIYNIEDNNGEIKLTMTLTSPMCPYGPELLESIKLKLSTLEEVKSVDINLVFEPPWKPSEELKLMMGLE